MLPTRNTNSRMRSPSPYIGESKGYYVSPGDASCSESDNIYADDFSPVAMESNWLRMIATEG